MIYRWGGKIVNLNNVAFIEKTQMNDVGRVFYGISFSNDSNYSFDIYYGSPTKSEFNKACDENKKLVAEETRDTQFDVIQKMMMGKIEGTPL